MHFALDTIARRAEAIAAGTFVPAVATFHAFTSGLFSSDRKHPCQVDAAGPRGVQPTPLANAFHVRA